MAGLRNTSPMHTGSVAGSPAGTDLFANRTIWDLLERRASATPDALFALDENGRSMTFGDLHRSAQRVAAGLLGHGIDTNSVVAWQLPNWLESVVLALGLSRLGAIQCPLVPILGQREVGFIVGQTEAGTIIVPRTWRGTDYTVIADAAIAERPETARLVLEGTLPDGEPTLLPEPTTVPKWLFYTSGTTADPKGVIHTDHTLMAGARGFHRSLRIDARDRLSMIIPFTHIGGIIHLIAALDTGCALLFAELFDPERTTQQLRDQQATLLPGGLPFVRAFFAYQASHAGTDPLFPHGRLMIHGGSSKPAGLYYEAQQRLHLPILSGYGMTECPMLAWSTPDDDDTHMATTEGRAVVGAEIRIVSLRGTILPAEEEGEVYVRGPQLMLGYVGHRTLHDIVDADGFFPTGDLGRLDAVGYVSITGRLKDVIIRNMENVSAREIEELLDTHDAVAEVAVIGLADVRTGERVCAVVVPTDPAHPPELAELCAHLLAAGLSNRKLPEQLEIVDQLPRNAMAKVLKAELRRQFSSES